jgi:hypothetical protein
VSKPPLQRKYLQTSFTPRCNESLTLPSGKAFEEKWRPSRAIRKHTMNAATLVSRNERPRAERMHDLGQFDQNGVRLATLVLFGKNFFKPVRLSLRNPPVR